MANVEFKCPNCGAPLSFDSSSQKVACPYCEAEFDVDDISILKDAFKEGDKEELKWEDCSSAYSEEELSTLNVYHCSSCGGELITDENTSATSCPYCGSPVIISSRLEGELKPNYVIPFKKNKEEAKQALKEYLKNKLFLPKVFKEENRIDEIKGIYVPFWIYDADCEGSITYKAMRQRMYVVGDYQYTERRYYKVVRDGIIGFNHIPVDGSSKMDDNLMESIEPFDFKEAKEFNHAYLTGYLSDKYDVSKEVCERRANERIRQETIDCFSKTVVGYNSFVITGTSLSLKNSKVSYALYPSWILNTSFEKQKFKFALNAQTGKLVGNLPCSKLKYTLWYLGFYLLSFLIVFLIGFGVSSDFSSDLAMIIALSVFISFIAPTVFCECFRRQLKPVKSQRGASTYHRSGSEKLYVKKDIYLYKTVTRVRIRDNSSNSNPRRR